MFILTNKEDSEKYDRVRKSLINQEKYANFVIVSDSNIDYDNNTSIY